MAGARRTLRAVFDRGQMQFGWLWVAGVIWVAVWVLPDGRWNRTFDGHAIATVERIESDGADPPDLHIFFVFHANGREYHNYGIDEGAPRDLVAGRELDVAYVSSDPTYAELRVPGVRTRFSSATFELAILGLFAGAGVVIMLFDLVTGIRERRRPVESDATEIAERTRERIWYLLVLPAAAFCGAVTLIVLYLTPSTP
ncbi:MAG TPA: hypothetical protein VFV99_26860 [Kofleriaceae bacterium]|nr:hypothetical protein [Kofleriaceae bacterium]